MKAPRLSSAETENDNDLSQPALAGQSHVPDPTTEADDKLEAAVQKRTAELQQRNHQLQLELAESRHVEAMLRQREEQFRLLIENATEIISILDANGIIRYKSPAVERGLGYKPEELIGRSAFEFVHPDDVGEVRRVFSQEIQDLAAKPIVEYRFQHKDGSWRVMRSVASNWLNHSSIAGVVVNSRDITERKQGEEELQHQVQQVNIAYQQSIIYAKELTEKIAERRQAEQTLAEERALLAQRIDERTAELSAANAELAQAARAKDEFLASMSHELRTPLNAILGLTEALQEQTRGPLNERQLKSLRTIEESGRHLLALINDILDLSKIEAGKLELQLDPVPVEGVCQASLQFIKEAAAKKKIQVSFTLGNNTTTLRADLRRLKQILVNLLSNAVKFTPEGGQVGLAVMNEAEQQVITFCVWDTGIGIASEDLPRLFKPFVQVDSSLSRRHEGTGLGLALVTRLVELHGGSLTVDSKPGQGSRFIVSLPWQESFENPQKLELAESLLDAFNFQRILIIEDSVTVAEQIARYLLEFNIQTVAHSQAQGALDKVLEVQPDIILLDLQLPDYSGWQLLSHFKADTQVANIPIIIVSVVDERPRGLALGAAEYLVKPVTRQQLQRALSRVAQRQADRQHGPAAARMAVLRNEQPLILLAEDNKANIQLMVDYLTDEGYRVVVARNGLEVIDRVNEEHPALILMDVQMPIMDGLEATRRLRANKQFTHIPIIAVTALAMPDDRERCLAAGANDYLSKPISLKKLVATITTHLQLPKA